MTLRLLEIYRQSVHVVAVRPIITTTDTAYLHTKRGNVAEPIQYSTLRLQLAKSRALCPLWSCVRRHAFQLREENALSLRLLIA